MRTAPAKTTESATNREAILQKIKARKLATEQAEKNIPVKKEQVKQKQIKSPVNKPEDKSEAEPEVAVLQNKTSQQAVARPSAEKPVMPDKNKKPVLSKELALAIKEFQLMVSQAKPAHDLIEHAVKTVLLCGVQRSVFVIKLPGKDLLVSRYTAQTSDDIAIKNLKIPVNKPHVFKLLMEKSRNLFLNNTNSAKYWNFIPEQVKLAIGVRSFFAMSIFVNNHAMGLMYADKLKGELTQAEFTQFQGVCRLLSKGIAQSAKNKKK